MSEKSGSGAALPLGVALALGMAVETTWHLVGKAQPPLSSFIVHLLGRDQHFDTPYAEQELGWTPHVGFEAGMREIHAWLMRDSSKLLTWEAYT